MNDQRQNTSSRNGDSVQQVGSKRPKRVKLGAEEQLRRMKEFDKRRDAFIASIRKSKG